MAALVVFYSRTGNTKRVAEALAKGLKCDADEILETKGRGGVLGYMGAGMDAKMKRASEIRETSKDPSDYDIAIIGTPIWAWTVSAPVRAYLSKNREKLRKVAFFCTGTNPGTTFAEMEGICGKKPVATLLVDEKDVKAGSFDIKKFAEEVLKA